MKVKQCTLIKPVTCKPTDLIPAAVKKLKKNQLRHLYVVDSKKKLLGVFSGIDVVYKVLAEGKDYRKMKIETVMNTEIVQFTGENDITEPIGFMSSTNIFSCPIVDDKQKLLGILSYKDAFNYCMQARKKK